ncbi:hypothetical protein CMEL01_02220 [Colletotrichum melonis]|uniref:Uncharacterized protein n=1 Tax=Colletotrichum melonis TaxID=1209925 RepID=A0AAI9XQK5_9PEZI|nr:hypothetical protein CMEL01_02220 [Colletotrichum melonis]
MLAIQAWNLHPHTTPLNYLRPRPLPPLPLSLARKRENITPESLAPHPFPCAEYRRRLAIFALVRRFPVPQGQCAAPHPPMNGDVPHLTSHPPITYEVPSQHMLSFYIEPGMALQPSHSNRTFRISVSS